MERRGLNLYEHTDCGLRGKRITSVLSRLFGRLRDDSFSMRSLWLTEANAFWCLKKIHIVKFQSQKRRGCVEWLKVVQMK